MTERILVIIWDPTPILQKDNYGIPITLVLVRGHLSIFFQSLKVPIGTFKVSVASTRTGAQSIYTSIFQLTDLLIDWEHKNLCMFILGENPTDSLYRVDIFHPRTKKDAKSERDLPILTESWNRRSNEALLVKWGQMSKIR